MTNKTKILILAAGKGTRMKSKKAKVLHELSCVTMINHVINICYEAGIKDISIVLGHKKKEIENSLNDKNINILYQKQQNGTADAVKCAGNNYKGYKGKIMILYGDMPLIKKETIKKIIANTKKDFSLVCFETKNPKGYGRVLNKDGFIKVVEEKNASKKIKAINLCYSGILCGPSDILFSTINKIKKNKKLSEYLFTDIFSLISNLNINLNILKFDEEELMGINNAIQLSIADNILQKRIKRYHLNNGVFIVLPDTVYIASDAKIGKDVTIEPNVFIGKNVIISNNVIIKSGSSIEASQIKENCEIGPICRLRNNTILNKNVKIGNFVEVKNSIIGNNSKVNHLSYIGDTKIGNKTNIGAGTITCNYDGIKKNKTIIGSNVFIGSNCSIIAPITINNNSFIAAGSTISNNVGKNDFSIARARQQIIKDGRRKFIKEK